MKITLKLLTLLLIVLALCVGTVSGAFMEETAETEAPATEQAEGSTAEGPVEAPVGPDETAAVMPVRALSINYDRIVLLIADDKVDSVLNDKREDAVSMAKGLAVLLRGSGTKLVITCVSDTEGTAMTEIDTNAQDAPAQAAAAVEALTADVNNDRADSLLAARLEKLSAAPEMKTLVVLVSDAKYAPGTKSFKEKLKTELIHCDDFAIAMTMFGSQSPEDAVALCGVLAVDEDAYTDITEAANRGTEAAMFVLGLVTDAEPLEAAAYTENAELLDAVAFVTAEGISATEPAEGTLKVYALTKTGMTAAIVPVNEGDEAGEKTADVTVTVSGVQQCEVREEAVEEEELLPDDVEVPADEVPAAEEAATEAPAAEETDVEEPAAEPVFAWFAKKGHDVELTVNAVTGINVVCKLDDTELESNAEGNFVVTPEEGEHVLTVSAAAANETIELGIEEQTFTFSTVSVPVWQGVTELTVVSKPDAPETFVTTLNPAAAFGNAYGQVNIAADGFDVSVDNDNHLVLNGTPDNDGQKVTVTVTAENSQGMTESQDIEVTLRYFPKVFEGLGIDPAPDAAPEDRGYFMEGETYTVKLTLDGTIDDVFSEWTDKLAVMNGETALEGTVADGWTYSVDAAKDMETVTLVLSGGSGLTKDISVSAPDGAVYAESDLFASVLKDITPEVDLDPRTELRLPEENEEPQTATFTVTLSGEDKEKLENTPDFDRYTLTAQYGADAPYAKENEATQMEGEPYKWTLTVSPMQTANFRFRLSAGDNVDSNDKEMTLKVEALEGVSGVIRQAACLVDGNIPVWQAPTMWKLYAAAGGAVLLILILIIVIARASKQKFKGTLRITVETEDDVYEGEPIDLTDWEKKKVTFGVLVTGSKLPPISLLTSADVRNKITFTPVKKGVRVINKSGKLSGESKAVLSRDDSVLRMKGDSGQVVTLTYER